MTSVLATGAVAQADTANVVKDPSEFIKIVGIYGLDKHASAFDSAQRQDTPNGYKNTTLEDNKIQPVDKDFTPSTNQFEVRDTDWYRLVVELLSPSDDFIGDPALLQAAICLYDSNTLTTDLAVENSCGRGGEFTIKSGGKPFPLGTNRGVVVSQVKPTAAMTAGYIHWDQDGQLRPGSLVDENTLSRVHGVAASFNGSTREIRSSFTDGTTPTFGDVAQVNVLFRLKDFASASTAWKIRVVAQYWEDPSYVDYELTSTESYTVAFRGSMTVDERPQQNFGEVFVGSQEASDTGIVKPGISTGKYRANGPAFISLAAGSQFTDADDSQNVLPFGSGPSPAADSVSLGCKPDGAGSLTFFETLNQGKSLFTGRDHFVVGSDVNADFTTPTHDCTLYVGTGVDPATYSNSMVVAVGPE